MKITVNGEERVLAGDTTLLDLVRGLGLEKSPIAVEVNRAVVPKVRHRETRLAEGDRLEIVTLVGGG